MPNIREKTWSAVTPANVEDAQWWEDHLISDVDFAKIGTAVQSVNNETPDASGNVELDTLPAGGTVGQVLTKQSSADGDADWDDPASSGHTIQNASGTDMAYRENLQFLNAQVTDDSVNDRTVVDCQGEKGDPGDAATVTVGTVTTLPAGSQATVTNSGTTSAAVFNFGIPKGADGTGVGDMTVAVYDPDGDVATAGGIVDYVAGEIVANPVEASTEDLTKLKIGNTIYKLAGGGTAIVQIPSVVGDSFTYDGTAQGPTVTGLDTTHCTVTGDTATTVGTYTLTISLNDTSSMVWSDMTTAPKTYTYDITKKAITIPTVTSNLVYDGTSQSPTITNPDSSWITVSGNTSGTSAGTYTVTFTLNDGSNTEWTDETITPKSSTWSIAKANQTISVSSDNVTLDVDHLTATVAVSGAETTLSVTSSDPTVVGVSESSGTVTISTINQTTGSATVSIYAAESSNYNQSNIASVYVTAQFTPEIVTWSNGTDAQLKAMLDAHYAGIIDIHDYWAVGNERTVNLSAMEATGVGEAHAAQTVTMVLMNAGGKTLADGSTTCAFVVGQKNSLNEAGAMASSSDRSGWDNIARRTWCNNVYYNALPAGFKALLKEFKDLASAGNGSSQIVTSNDYCALAAEIEVVGSTTYSVNGEGSQFKYYETSANRIKKIGAADQPWWLRSPQKNGGEPYCAISGAGTADYFNRNRADVVGLAPICCI